MRTNYIASCLSVFVVDTLLCVKSLLGLPAVSCLLGPYSYYSRMTLLLCCSTALSLASGLGLSKLTAFISCRVLQLLAIQCA